ncbi:hypothetical protein MARI_31290 [Marinobacter sp. JH2]|nr:hypothetical protein [Marinobacter sp. JH2]QBM18986.1 hypothetical protein MARI_31290 [Marinobacter sp. JH2]
MTDNARIRFLVLFSISPEKMTDVGDFVAGQLSQRFGGTTVLHSSDSATLTGFWADDGQAFKSAYEGEIHKEPVISLMLSVMPDDEEEAFNRIKATLAEAAKRFALDCRHVHVETLRASARHFDLQADV